MREESINRDRLAVTPPVADWRRRWHLLERSRHGNKPKTDRNRAQTKSPASETDAGLHQYPKPQGRYVTGLRSNSGYLRCRILLRIFRFFRPILRRPLPVFLTPISPALPSSVFPYEMPRDTFASGGGEDSNPVRFKQGSPCPMLSGGALFENPHGIARPRLLRQHLIWGWDGPGCMSEVKAVPGFQQSPPTPATRAATHDLAWIRHEPVMGVAMLHGIAHFVRNPKNAARKLEHHRAHRRRIELCRHYSRSKSSLRFRDGMHYSATAFDHQS